MAEHGIEEIPKNARESRIIDQEVVPLVRNLKIKEVHLGKNEHVAEVIRRFQGTHLTKKENNMFKHSFKLNISIC